MAPNLTVLPDSLDVIDDLGAAELVLELGHLCLVEALGLLGGVVLGVLGQIAVLARIRDLLNDARALLDLEAVQLRFELLEPLNGHRHFFHGLGSHLCKCRCPASAPAPNVQSHSVYWVWPALIRTRRTTTSSGCLAYIRLQRRHRKGARHERLDGLRRRQRAS